MTDVVREEVEELLTPVTCGVDSCDHEAVACCKNVYGAVVPLCAKHLNLASILRMPTSVA